MNKIQINSDQEYRQFTFPLCQEHGGRLDTLFGLRLIWECWDTDDDGNSLDEEGNIIPEDTAENVEVEQWVKDLKYPIIISYWIESGDYFIGVMSIVSKHDFV